jgi:multisubunit Na+/H+ antiporter MnhC subunit
MNETLKRILKNIMLSVIFIALISGVFFVVKEYFPQKIIAFGNQNTAIVIYAINTHIETPKVLKAVYISSWAAGSQKISS